MSNEHPPKENYKEHQHELEKNVLKESLTTGWQKFKQGKLVSYRVMAISLITVTAIGLYFYIRSGKRSEISAQWVAMESANSTEALDEIAKKNPNTTTGHLAQLHLARFKLGPTGIDELTTRDLGKQRKAVENIESARDSFEQLIGEFQNDPVLKVECVLGRAKAEAALVGMYKEGNTGDFRGTVPKLVEWLEKLAIEADGTPWGEDAKKLAESLKSGPTAEEFARVRRGLYRIDTLGTGVGGLGGFGPKAPGDAPGVTLPILPGGEKKEPGPISPPEKPKEPEKKDEKGKQPEKAKEPEKKDGTPPKPPEPGPKPPEKK